MFLVLWLAGSGAAPAAGQEDENDEPAGVELIDLLRRNGWQAAVAIAGRLESADREKFPGVRAFARGVRELEEEIDTDAPPHEWPAIDVDALLTKNPEFWRAACEVAPGEPGFLLLHASLLLTAGEIDRGHNLIHLAQQRPGELPKWRRAMQALDFLVHRALRENRERLQRGIRLHNREEFEAAIAVYEAALEVWPRSARTHYQIGFARSAGKIGEPDFHFAQSRRYDPFRREAYQGRFDREEIESLEALHKAVGLWNSVVKRPVRTDPKTLIALSELCQRAAVLQRRLHEPAIVARQITAAGQDGYRDEDRKFIAASLRDLLPKAAAEKTLEPLTATSRLHLWVVPERRPEPAERHQGNGRGTRN